MHERILLSDYYLQKSVAYAWWSDRIVIGTVDRDRDEIRGVYFTSARDAQDVIDPRTGAPRDQAVACVIRDRSWGRLGNQPLGVVVSCRTEDQPTHLREAVEAFSDWWCAQYGFGFGLQAVTHEHFVRHYAAIAAAREQARAASKGAA